MVSVAAVAFWYACSVFGTDPVAFWYACGVLVTDPVVFWYACGVFGTDPVVATGCQRVWATGSVAANGFRGESGVCGGIWPFSSFSGVITIRAMGFIALSGTGNGEIYMTASVRVDVVIIGAGSAGSAAALLCARRGLRVLCLERRQLSEAGGRWVNGVPAWMFDAAGLTQPRGEELLPSGGEFHLFAGYGPMRLVLRNQQLHSVDMRGLVARLQREAMEAGAQFMDDIIVYGFDGECVNTSAGPVWARFVVDASGIHGAGLLDAPALEREDFCAAAQQVREVRDMEAARAYFAGYGVRWGDTLCFTGVSGGYSVLNVTGCGDRVSILTGSIPGLGYQSGRKLLDDFVEAQSWVGERIFGGNRAIPLRRPLDCIARGKVALLGDAACQVFTAHGSGVGIGLIAARMLADSLATGRGTQDYAVRWQRTWGGQLAASEMFRRFSQVLNVEQVSALFAQGLLNADMALETLEQRVPTVNTGRLIDMLQAVRRDVAMSGRLLPVVVRAGLAQKLYRTYPAHIEDLPGWQARARVLFSDEAEQKSGSRVGWKRAVGM